MQHDSVDAKKIRERKLIEQFLAISHAFEGAEFEIYDENPDLIYRWQGAQIGFESIIVTLNERELECVFRPATCELAIGLAANQKDLEALQEQLTQRFFDHLRQYKLPTVIVFSLASKYRLEAVAQHFRLPELGQNNIRDYFVCDGRRALKLAETSAL